jgi:hypothetical protein
MGRTVLAFVAAALTATLLGVTASAQVVLAGLAEAGAAATLSERLTVAGQDLAGLGPVYLGLVAAAMLILFTVARFLGPALWTPALILAGTGAVLAVVQGLEAAFGVPVISGARTAPGLLLQGLAGVSGGLVFRLIAGPLRKAG